MALPHQAGVVHRRDFSASREQLVLPDAVSLPNQRQYKMVRDNIK